MKRSFDLFEGGYFKVAGAVGLEPANQWGSEATQDSARVFA